MILKLQKTEKTVLLALAGFLSLFFLILIAISLQVSNKVEEIIDNSLGGLFQYESVSYNPFKQHLSINNIIVSDDADESALLNIESVLVDLKLSKLFSTINFDTFTVRGLAVNLYSENFDRSSALNNKLEIIRNKLSIMENINLNFSNEILVIIDEAYVANDSFKDILENKFPMRSLLLQFNDDKTESDKIFSIINIIFEHSLNINSVLIGKIQSLQNQDLSNDRLNDVTRRRYQDYYYNSQAQSKMGY